MRIQVNGATCGRCIKLFFEIDGENIQKCPHCQADTSVVTDYGVKRTVKVTVDPTTGVVVMWDESREDDDRNMSYMPLYQKSINSPKGNGNGNEADN